VLLLVAAITTAGLLLRVPPFGDSLFGDEVSTYFIANADSVGGVLDLVRSDQEVSPPLYFVLAWATEGLGDPAESLRVTSLIAGVAAIPLTYQLGVLTVGRRAGVVGAALVALSPILIFHSTEARAFMLMLAFVLLSSLALVKALEPGRNRLWWWIGYAAFSCAAIWTHYTAVFVLGGQFGWAMWARPRARRALCAANIAVVIGYVPWIASGFREDRASPGNVIDVLHPFSLESAANDLARWVIGQPFLPLSTLPGDAAIAMIVSGVAISALALTAATAGRRDAPRRRPSDRLILVLVLALASPVGALLYSLFIESLIVPRNLLASWPGLALAIGALATSGRGPLRIVSVGLLIGGMSIGAVKSLDADSRRPDYESVASFIERVGSPDSPILEVPFVANPLSSFEVTLNDPGQSLVERRKVFRVGVPTRRAQERARAAGLPPAHTLLPRPPADKLARRAGKLARGDTLFVVSPLGAADSVLGAVPSRFRRVETRTFPGLTRPQVYVFRDSRPSRGSD
jgi:mannosyltransferase